MGDIARMRRRLQIAFAVLVSAVLGLTAQLGLHQREPVYSGHPVSYWINHWGDIYAPWNGEHPDFDRGPLGWMPDADAKAVPFLVKALKNQECLPGNSYPKIWLRTPPWVRARLPRPIIAKLVRINAAVALGRMGATAKPAVPALFRALRTSESRTETAAISTALGRIGAQDSEVQAELTKALNDSSPAVRSGAATALGLIGVPGSRLSYATSEQ